MHSSNHFSLAINIGILSLLMALLPASLVAAPSIQHATFNDSGDIVIEGSEFGEGPKVALHDDFSRTIFSDDSVTLSPRVGRWLTEESNSSSVDPFIDDKHGTTSLFVRGNGSSRFVFGIPDSSGPHGLKTFQEVYLSYTIRDFGDFPGTSGTPTEFSTQSSTKDAWMMLGNRGDNTEYAVSRGDPSGHDLYIPGWTGSGFNLAGNYTRLRPTYWQGELTKNWAFGDWNTKMFHAELDPANPYGDAEGFFAFLNKNAYHVNVREGGLMSDQQSQGVPYAAWDRIKFFKWMNVGDADVKRVVDEIYVAIGDNANARVLVTDNESLENSTRVFHLSPKNWSDTTIVARFPEYLPKNGIYYLHVLDSNNATSKGMQLCQNCPKSPEKFSVD